MEDFHIIRRVTGGDKQAFEMLVRRYQRPLFHYLARMGVIQDEAEDLVQETFIRAYRHLGRYDPQQAKFTTWLYTIARRLGINALSRRRVPTSRLEESKAAMDVSYTDHYGDGDMIKQRINDALLQLPHKFRSPVALAYLKELSMEDIAHIEACSIGTVKSRIHRGKKRLQVLLADLSGDKEYD